jgi:hypothetical protein
MQFSILLRNSGEGSRNSKPVRDGELWRTMARVSNTTFRKFNRTETRSPRLGRPHKTAESPPTLISRVRPRVTCGPESSSPQVVTGALSKCRGYRRSRLYCRAVAAEPRVSRCMFAPSSLDVARNVSTTRRVQKDCNSKREELFPKPTPSAGWRESPATVRCCLPASGRMRLRRNPGCAIRCLVGRAR